MKGIAPNRALRWILAFLAGLSGAIALRMLGAPLQVILAFFVLLITPRLLALLLLHEIGVATRHRKAKNYEQAVLHARRILAYVKWLRWLKPLMRLYGTRRDPEAMVLNCLGGAQTSLGDYLSARSNLEAAIMLDPADPLPYFNMGLMTLKTGSAIEAGPWFERAQERGYPGDAVIRRQAGLDRWRTTVTDIPSPPAAPPYGNASLYQVQMLNDEKTPMEFVVVVLERFFSLSRTQSTNLMLEIHHQGRATCGVFSQPDAEAKVEQIRRLAAESGFPLTCITAPAA